jgi:hypothetical protein
LLEINRMVFEDLKKAAANCDSWLGAGKGGV